MRTLQFKLEMLLLPNLQNVRDHEHKLASETFNLKYQKKKSTNIPYYWKEPTLPGKFCLVYLTKALLKLLMNLILEIGGLKSLLDPHGSL